MKKIFIILIVFVGLSGIAHAAQVTDCSVQNVGVPCVIPSSGATGSCQLTYDGSSMTCDVTKNGVAGTITQTAAQTQTTQQPVQGFTALAPIPGLTDSGTMVVNSATLADFFNNLYKYLIGLAATLAVIEIIWGGFQISTQDSISKHGEGKERITQAIFGLILILSPVLVFSIINPSILNLSVNLPRITPIKSNASKTLIDATGINPNDCSQFSQIRDIGIGQDCSSLGSGWISVPAACGAGSLYNCGTLPPMIPGGGSGQGASGASGSW